jgi:hypothetical protein
MPSLTIRDIKPAATEIYVEKTETSPGLMRDQRYESKHKPEQNYVVSDVSDVI